MKYKKGDLVKVIELLTYDAEEYGIKEGKTYKVVDIINNEAYINAGKEDRLMCNCQIEKVKKKKSKKDLRIQELEKINTDLLKIIMVLST